MCIGSKTRGVSTVFKPHINNIVYPLWALTVLLNSYDCTDGEYNPVINYSTPLSFVHAIQRFGWAKLRNQLVSPHMFNERQIGNLANQGSCCASWQNIELAFASCVRAFSCWNITLPSCCKNSSRKDLRIFSMYMTLFFHKYPRWEIVLICHPTPWYWREARWSNE